MIIRKAQKQDLERIIELWRKMDSSHLPYDPGFYARKPQKTCRKMARKYHRSLLTKAGSFLLVAEQRGELLGYLAAKTIALPPVCKLKRAGLVDAVCVRKDRRRRGAGKKLLRAAQAEFRKRKIRQVRLYVDLENGPARELYRALGFRGRQVLMLRNL